VAGQLAQQRSYERAGGSRMEQVIGLLPYSLLSFSF
jgi:hypothetical protein